MTIHRRPVPEYEDRHQRQDVRCAAASAALLICLVSGFPAAVSVVQAAESTNCTPEQKAQADKRLWLNAKDKKKSVERHLPQGVPQSTITGLNESLLVHRDYVINYNTDLLVPVWTAHRLDAKGLGKVGRINCFRRDPRINAPAASLRSDYSEPVFDQGHMSPNGDMSRALYPVLNSFPLSNMTPQYCQLNRGVWQIFESLVRLWVKERDSHTVYVITGSVFDHDSNGQRDSDADAKRMKSNNGKTRVAVPSHLYKILMDRRKDGTVESLAILLLHDQTDLDGDAAIQYLGNNVRRISDIEAVTATTFGITANEATALWPFTGMPARSLVNAVCRKTAGHQF